MTKTTKQLLIIPIVMLSLLPILSNAENITAKNKIESERGINTQIMGTTTKPMNISTTTKPMMSGVFMGEISTINSPSFSILIKDKNTTITKIINTNEKTIIRSGSDAMKLSKLKVGQRVTVIAVPNTVTSSDTVLAARINVLPTINTNKNNNRGFFDKITRWIKNGFR